MTSRRKACEPRGLGGVPERDIDGRLRGTHEESDRPVALPAAAPAEKSGPKSEAYGGRAAAGLHALYSSTKNWREAEEEDQSDGQEGASRDRRQLKRGAVRQYTVDCDRYIRAIYKKNPRTKADKRRARNETSGDGIQTRDEPTGTAR